MFDGRVTAQSTSLLENANHSAVGLGWVAEEEADLSMVLGPDMKSEMHSVHQFAKGQARSLVKGVCPARLAADD